MTVTELEALTSKWRKLYEKHAQEIDQSADKGGADWESLCVGWAMAQGLTVKSAYAFYQAMIPLDLF